MHLFGATLPKHADSIASSTREVARKALQQKNRSPLLPLIPTCPSPTCVCAETPAGLDIERDKDINGSMVAYAQHVLISSGQNDWKSKIEDEKDVIGWGQFTARLKTAFRRGGQFHDPYNNILISTSSFQTLQTVATHGKPPKPLVDVLLFPAFKYLPFIRGNKNHSITDLARGFLLPEKIHPCSEDFSDVERRDKYRNIDEYNYLPKTAQPITNPTILICSHASRDSRCGILGPLLRDEFVDYLESQDIPVRTKNFQSTRSASTYVGRGSESAPAPSINIGLISHIGGHKWAGNVILYIPPNWRVRVSGGPPDSETISSVAGKGIWYGRVEPKHVQGIVEETLLKGNVIRELFRGGIGQDGQNLRI